MIPVHQSFEKNPHEYKTWLKALWASAKEYGLDEDAVRDLAESVSGKRSVSSMTRDQFKAWFARLEELYGKKKKRRSNHGAHGGSRRKKKKDAVPGGDNLIEIATPEQVVKIRTFARTELKWQKGWDAGFTECTSISKIIERHTKGRKRYIRQLTLQEARSVIEALKKIYERKHGPGAA